MATMPDLRSRNVWWIISGVIGVVLLATGAFMFVSAHTTGRTLDDSAALRAADVTLVGQDVAMKSIGQLVLISQDAALGVADQDDVDLATVEAERATAELGARFATLDGTIVGELTPAFAEWQTAAADVISLAGSGMSTQAEEQLTATLVPAAAELSTHLTEERDALAQSVADARDGLAALVKVAGFLTIFLVPVIAVLFYRLAARRQLQQATAHLDARIEAERSVAAEKDQFISSVSNELRTPLAAIYGFSEELLDKGMVDPGAGDLVGMINRESAELARMAEDLLVAAHDDSTPLQVDRAPVDMEQHVANAIVPFQKRGATIGGTWGPGSVSADPIRVKQILRNLLANAVEHGGADIRIYGDAAGSNYVLSVEDNGPGIPVYLEDKLFTRFMHRDEEANSTAGLGLAVARTLAEAMGGSLDYQRVANRTAFVLALPLAETSGR